MQFPTGVNARDRMLLTASEGGGSFVDGNVTDHMIMLLLEAAVKSPPNAPGQVAA